MKEHPILFNAPMVRALLAGRKTQTRRIVKPRKDLGFGCLLAPRELAGEVNNGSYENSPYGQPGDRLWVREAFAYSVIDPEGLSPEDDPENYDIIYRATDQPAGGWSDGAGNRIKAPWKPSIHMPRWASRITLEIVSVRVERLQAISEADAIAEGAQWFNDIPLGSPMSNKNRWSMESPASTDECLSTARFAFANLFCNINGKGKRGVIDLQPWDCNPWVWVVEFRRVES